jgi:hypothetical protein
MTLFHATMIVLASAAAFAQQTRSKGQRVGPDPVGHYVYLWQCRKIERYFGHGTEWQPQRMAASYEDDDK